MSSSNDLPRKRVPFFYWKYLFWLFNSSIFIFSGDVENWNIKMLLMFFISFIHGLIFFLVDLENCMYELLLLIFLDSMSQLCHRIHSVPSKTDVFFFILLLLVVSLIYVPSFQPFFRRLFSRSEPTMSNNPISAPSPARPGWSSLVIYFHLIRWIYIHLLLHCI